MRQNNTIIQILELLFYFFKYKTRKIKATETSKLLILIATAAS